MLVNEPRGMIYSSPHGKLYFVLSDSILTSTDQGRSWSKVTQLPDPLYIYSFAVNQNNAEYLLTNQGIFKSSDDGGTWDPFGASLSGYNKINFADNGIIFLTSGGRMDKSTDNGMTVRTIKDIGSSDQIKETGTNGKGTIYIATYRSGIFRSFNNGDSWTSANSGIPANSMVGSFIVEPNGICFALVFNQYTSTAELYCMQFWPGVWTRVDQGLFKNSLYCLAQDKTGNIYAGTLGSGVFIASQNRFF